MWGPVVCCSPSPLSTRFWHIPSPPKDEFLLRRDQIGKSFFLLFYTKWLKRGLAYRTFTRVAHNQVCFYFLFGAGCVLGCLEGNLSLKQKQQLQMERNPWNLEQRKVVAPQRPLRRPPSSSTSLAGFPSSSTLPTPNPLFLVDWKQPSDCTFRKRFCQTMDDLPRGGPPPPETLSCACAANFARFLKDIV